MIKKVLKKGIVSILLLFFVLSFLVSPLISLSNNSEYCSNDEMLGDCFKVIEDRTVYLGGNPIGIIISQGGITVIGHGVVETQNGKVQPISNEKIEKGDVIVELNGIKTPSVRAFSRILNSECRKNVVVTLKVKRENVLFNVQAQAVCDVTDNTYKLGLMLRDETVGIGTMTYIKQNGNFAALGHPICEQGTQEFVKVGSGRIFHCEISGVQKGKAGKAGELKGAFVMDSAPIGRISKNNLFGLYGKMNNCDFSSKFEIIKVPVAQNNEIKLGKAQIRTTVDGLVPKYYDIKIVKCKSKDKMGDKSMVIKICDKELIKKTGGIVQGMSGSPIIQNGKLVGAVTHVFVNDSTRGYGIYADWMWKN